MIAAAIGLGAARGLYGASVAKKQSNANKNAINRAYGVADQKMGLDQGYARQSENESLNARGILSSGGVGQSGSTPIRDSLNTMFGGKNAQANDDRQVGFYNKAAAGSLGGSNTLSGQANRDMTDQMYFDRRELNQNKVDLLDQNKGALKQGYTDAITGGVNTGLSVYGIGKSFQNGGAGGQIPNLPAGGPQVSSSTGAGTYQPGPMPAIQGALGLPVNPVFTPQAGSGTIVAGAQPNATFNVGRGPQP